MANPSVFPQQVLHLIGDVIETLAASTGSIYNECLVTRNLKNYSNKLLNIHLIKKLTSEILLITPKTVSGDINGFHVSLVTAWSKGLHCSSMKIKENVFVALTGILESVLEFITLIYDQASRKHVWQKFQCYHLKNWQFCG